MSVIELADELSTEVEKLYESAVQNELAPLLPIDEIEGLLPRLRAGITKVAEKLRRTSSP